VSDNGDGTLSIAQGNVDASSLNMQLLYKNASVEQKAQYNWEKTDVVYAERYIYTSDDISAICQNSESAANWLSRIYNKGIASSDVSSVDVNTGKIVLTKEAGLKLDIPLSPTQLDPKVYLKDKSDPVAMQDTGAIGVTIAPEDTAELPVFVNTLKPGSLAIEKRIEGDNVPGQEFTFHVKLTGDNVDPTATYDYDLEQIGAGSGTPGQAAGKIVNPLSFLIDLLAPRKAYAQEASWNPLIRSMEWTSRLVQISPRR
jgi:hypothetical protein